MNFPEPVNLPFNGEIIRSRFVQRKPGELEDAGPGYWAFIQGDGLLAAGAALYRGELPGAFASLGAPMPFGEWDGAPIRVLAVPKEHAVPGELSLVPLDQLSYELQTLFGLARQVLYWERMSSHCSRCGGDMEGILRSWGKRCLTCGHQHFPHIHPCVIVLIKRGAEFLLVRKPEWPEGRFSLVAGFVDFGESLEECVEREVFEETGLKVTGIRYVGSQNWPFPSQLMAGFVAEYVSGELTLEKEELADGGWFAPDRMPPMLPPKRSIARWIIDRYGVGNG